MTASPRILAERQARYDSRMERAAEVVPHGMYCYEITGAPRVVELADGTQQMRLPTRKCPYWTLNGHKRSQENGYCRLLKAGDWMPNPHGTMLLWDQVKECSVNKSFDDDEDDVELGPEPTPDAAA